MATGFCVFPSQGNGQSKRHSRETLAPGHSSHIFAQSEGKVILKHCAHSTQVVPVSHQLTEFSVPALASLLISEQTHVVTCQHLPYYMAGPMR